MKINKIILTGIIATAMIGTSFAANQVDNSIAIAVVNEENTPKEIAVSELPQAVKDQLKADACEAQRAFLLYKDDQPIYQVEALKEGEQIILHYYADGKEVEG